jgi:GTP-binding protein
MTTSKTSDISGSKKMNFQKASFAACYGTIDQMKPSRGPEVSFAGRSNVGKSSLLNKLMFRKGLAKVSATPGKTATINFYDVDGIDLVDLPGYGYAQVSKSELVRWSDLIEGYFNEDREFALVVSLIDIRHEPTKLDCSMVDFLIEADLPFAIALTKADKLSKQKAASARAKVRRYLHLPIDVPIIVTSGQSGEGVEDLRELIAQAVGRA